MVRDQVLDKLSFAFEDLGAQQVKNITRPVEAYRVDLGSGAPAAAGRRRWQRLTRGPRRWFAAGVLAFGLAGMAGWALPQFWRTAPATQPPAFSVAVLSFAAPGGTPADQQFAELLTQQITGALGRAMHYATIVSHHHVATEAGKAIDTRAIGRERNVRYLLEGDVHTGGDKVSVTAKLVDTESATQLWSDQFDAAHSQWDADSGKASWPLIKGLRAALWSAEEQRVAHGSGGAQALGIWCCAPGF